MLTVKVQAWCDDQGGIPFIEVSSLENFNVDLAFKIATELGYQSLKKRTASQPPKRYHPPAKQDSCCVS